MGYDMHVEQKDQDVEEQVAKARRAFDKAVKARDKNSKPDKAGELQDAVMKAMDEVDRADKNYFRLNIFGMSRMCDDMARLGMVEDVTVPRFPDAEYFGMNDALLYRMEELDDEDQKAHPVFGPYARRIDKHLSASFGASVIPGHKFGSNDGWLVTPDEIRAALAKLEALPDTDFMAVRARWETGTGDNVFDDWVDFLRFAAGRGGFRVH